MRGERGDVVGEGKRRAWKGREVKIGIYKTERNFLKAEFTRDPSKITMLSCKRMTDGVEAWR